MEFEAYLQQLGVGTRLVVVRSAGSKLPQFCLNAHDSNCYKWKVENVTSVEGNKLQIEAWSEFGISYSSKTRQGRKDEGRLELDVLWPVRILRSGESMTR